MLRRSRRATPTACCAQAMRGFAGTLTLLRLQNQERVLDTHGAGLVTHASMARATPNQMQSMYHVTRAPPAADLFRTAVHEGLGTSAQDPYTRTLSNQESLAPESTVLGEAADTAATLDERRALATSTYAGMQYWMAGAHARLPMYVRDLLTPDAAPVSASAERLVGQFATHVAPALMEARPDVESARLLQLWHDAVARYDMTGAQLTAALLFDRDAFAAHLAELHDTTVKSMRALCAGDEVTLALEVLRRRAVLQRNAVVQERLLRPLEDGLRDGSLVGDAVWGVVFDAAAAVPARELFPETADGGHARVAYAWQALRLEDAPRVPSVTAPVALYLSLLGCALRHDARGAATPASPSVRYARLDPIVKRRFVIKVLEEQVLRSEPGCKALAKALQSAALHHLSREVALCETMCDEQQLLAADCAPLAERFQSTNEVKSLLSLLLRGTDVEACRHVAKTLGLPATSRDGHVPWDNVLTRLDWPTHWRRLAVELLSDKATLIAVHRLVRNAIGAKGVTRHLFCEGYEKELRDAIAARDGRAATRAARVTGVVRELSSYQLVDQTLRLLREMGVDMTELDAAATSANAVADGGDEVVVTPALLHLVLQAVAARHPSWLRARVLPLDKPLPGDAQTTGVLSALTSVTDALRVMVRVYVRLAYVPQAGAAAIAQHTRHRIGPIGMEPHQFNIGAEMGFVEQYDNLQYKRYDWQGWYQRMVDVHNRNVSIRCRIDDLKRLDALGEPFVDLQTERRLRVLAADRVGMGVLKLDSDKYEDQHDNVTHGCTKLSELLADARKAQLGPEYWPTVEVKVRRPSGQSQAQYSLIDFDRIEQRSKELYVKYREAKKRSLFVTPMDTWLEIKGMQVRKSGTDGDTHGYTINKLEDAQEKDAQTSTTSAESE